MTMPTPRRTAPFAAKIKARSLDSAAQLSAMSGFLKSINHSNRLSLSPAQTKNLQDVISSEKRVVEA